jgi:hypothetical protein
MVVTASLGVLVTVANHEKVGRNQNAERDACDNCGHGGGRKELLATAVSSDLVRQARWHATVTTRRLTQLTDLLLDWLRVHCRSSTPSS